MSIWPQLRSLSSSASTPIHKIFAEAALNQVENTDFELIATSTMLPAPIPVIKVALVLIAMAAIPIGLSVSRKTFDYNPLAYKVAWALAFSINLITVSLPGRFDSQAQENKQGFPWVTLFEPAGWAFAIWGIIYAGELAVTAYTMTMVASDDVLRSATPYWVAGNLFQSLWCLTFRPQFRGAMWLPMSLLAAGSGSLLLSHRALSAGMASLGVEWTKNKLLLLLLRSPISLHTAWLAAATLLNLNGWAVMASASYPAQIALAFASAFLGATYGVLATWFTGDPLLAGTIAWALSALSARTLLKVEKNVIEYVSADTQKALALAEYMLANALKSLAFGAALFEAVRRYL
jgi:hypothetical protein